MREPATRLVESVVAQVLPAKPPSKDVREAPIAKRPDLDVSFVFRGFPGVSDVVLQG